MIKRIFDIVFSSLGLIVLLPFLVIFAIIIWLQDRHNPFYIASRVGKNFKNFKMIKLRTMVPNADKTGVDSTSGDDKRITPIGKIIRRYKLDELSQLWNVLLGQMSLVGPRPQVQRDVNLYTEEEKHLLDVAPGITDFSSIIFSDESEILKGKGDPDLAYNQLIRPWKSRLGLFYIKNRTLLVDFKIILLTALAIISRSKALKGIHSILSSLNAPEDLQRISLRNIKLIPMPPPGAENIVQSRALFS